MDTQLSSDLASAYLAYAHRTNPSTLVGWSGAAIPGMPQQIIGTWMARNTWDNLAKGQWLAANATYTAYVAANPNGAADIGVPLVPHDSGQPLNGLLDLAISGAQDLIYLTMGQQLAINGPATVFARLWWEMNMMPNPASQIDRGKFRAAWQRAAPLIRAGFAAAAKPGQKLRIVFCPLTDGAAWDDFWPGSQHVDVVALDAYGAQWSAAPPTGLALLAYVNTALAKLAAFGKLHSKPLALGEWANWQTGGTGTTNRGLGDFPDYIDAIFNWAQANPVAYLCYFNIADGGVGQTLATLPLSLARIVARTAQLA